MQKDNTQEDAELLKKLMQVKVQTIGKEKKLPKWDPKSKKLTRRFKS